MAFALASLARSLQPLVFRKLVIQILNSFWISTMSFLIKISQSTLYLTSKKVVTNIHATLPIYNAMV
ncbi:MAG: hypothetical protein U5L45_06450 [Saprospiraceae bacterium]|nr:hypothetical protein [Saprospiraceae bacterium]